MPGRLDRKATGLGGYVLAQQKAGRGHADVVV